MSCLVPVFNAEAYVGEALDSIFSQSHRNLEVIVVDDGSTDRSAEIVRGFAGRVRLVEQGRRGVGAARNACLRNASGEFIAFLDADDRWHEKKVEKQLRHLDANPGLAGCFVWAENFWVAELEAERRRMAGTAMARPNPLYGFGSLLIAQEAFDRVGPVNETLSVHEDVEWLRRAEDAGLRFGMIEEVLYFRRIHANNTFRQNTPTQREETLDLVRRHLASRRASNS